MALLAALICGAYQLWLGGAGAAMGLSVVFESAALGVVFHFWRQRAARPMGWVQLWGFGLLVHGIMLGLIMLLPGAGRDGRRGSAGAFGPASRGNSGGYHRYDDAGHGRTGSGAGCQQASMPGDKVLIAFANTLTMPS